MQKANPTAVKKKKGICCSCCEVGGCESTLQQGLKGRAGSHVTLAFLEGFDDKEARVEEAVDAVGLRAGGRAGAVSQCGVRRASGRDSRGKPLRLG